MKTAMQPALLTLWPPKPSTGFVGRVGGGDYWFLDAAPFVMERCRAMFRNGLGSVQGKHTHAMLALPKTPDTGKDLVWLIDRYPLEVSDLVWDELHLQAARYDRAVLAAAVGDGDRRDRFVPGALEMDLPARPHQVGARNLVWDVFRLLVADDIGLGKTITAISILAAADCRPAIIVVPTHLCIQWEHQIKRFLPGASTHIITGTKVHGLPKVDIYITAYPRLYAWQDILVPMKMRTVIFDEVQDLRKVGTLKRGVARALSSVSEYCVGLSATPIYNLGQEIWSVLDVLSPDSMGSETSFAKEWCAGGAVSNPVALHSYLKTRGLMLRRTKADLGIQSDPVLKDVITLEGDLTGLEKIQNVMKQLALSVLSNRVGESSDSAKKLDWKLRHATGVAKAKSVAEFVRMLVSSGEKVLLAGWHREVYDHWLRELASCHPVMYTGSESPSEKAKTVEAFVKGRSQVFICSLRSGSGLDGLQSVCSNIVFGELDWSPHVMDQMIGRLDREGQTKGVNCYFLTIDDGSDPFMMEVLGEKRSQHDGVIEGKEGAVEILEATGLRNERIRAMAEGYLASIGEALPVVAPVKGLHAEIVAALRRLSLPCNSEREMQEALFAALPTLVIGEISREVRIGDRSRLDFLIVRGEERVAIECKIAATGKAEVYRQVRRYAEEAGITSCILLAPWGGVSDFVVSDIPVSIVDWSKAKL